MKHLLLRIVFLWFMIGVAACDNAPTPIAVYPAASPLPTLNPVKVGSCQSDPVILQAGVDDGFDPANEVEAVNATDYHLDLVQLFRNPTTIAAIRNFDEAARDQWFAHTFSDLLKPGQKICAAALETRVRPGGENDTIVLMFLTKYEGKLVGTQGAWWRHLGTSQKPGQETGGLFDYPWVSGSPDGVIALDLAALPLADGETKSIIAELNEYSFLDVVIQNDTAVDYLTLKVWHTEANATATPVKEAAADCQGESAVFAGGLNDDFDPANGPEPAEADEALVQFLREKSGIVKTLRSFDEIEPNHVFAHRFTGLAPDRRRICEANIELHVRPDRYDNSANDSLALGFAVNAAENPFIWRRHYGNADPAAPGLLPPIACEPAFAPIGGGWAAGDPAETIFLDRDQRFIITLSILYQAPAPFGATMLTVEQSETSEL